MNSAGHSNPMLRGILDGAVLLLLIGVLSGVFVYDLNASKSTPMDWSDEIEEEPETPSSESPPPELPVVELPPEPPAAPPPPPAPLPEPAPPEIPSDPTPRIEVRFFGQGSGRFGMFTTTGNPDDPQDDLLLMTYSENGKTNNTRVWLDGSTPNYGDPDGTVVIPQRLNTADGVHESAWKYKDVTFTQTVKLVPGHVSRRLDTARVMLVAKNESDRSHEVGARFMIDTLIGGNDGVPFIVAGKQNLIQEATVFRDREVPHFIRALQNPSLKQPGVIVDIGFRCPDAERPTEVALTHWPRDEAVWDYDRTTPLGTDSSAGMFYLPRPLAAGESRTMGFTYGLGSISSTGSRNGRLSLTAGGPFTAGGSFWLVALVQASGLENTVELMLPKGMTLGAGESRSKPVVASGNLSQISWLINIAPGAEGAQEVAVKLLPEDVIEKQRLEIEAPAVKLSLKAPDRTTAGTAFWVSSLVLHPRQGQAIELKVPSGLSLEPGHLAKQTVPQGKGQQQINWLLRGDFKTSGPQVLSIRLEPDNTSVETTTRIDPPVSKISLTTPEQASAGKAFWVSAVVRYPKPNQTVELVLPEALTLSRGHTSKQAVSTDKNFHQVNWLLKSSARTAGDQKLQVRLDPDDRAAEATVNIIPGNIID